jgi:DNA mismatch repair ATPase MutS
MLNDRGIHIPDGADVLSLYQSVVQEEKIKDGVHNFQIYAAEMLAIMGIPVPIDGNVLSIYNKAQFDLGLSPLQNMSEESTAKKDNNMHLTKMANALPEWNTSFANFCIEFPKGTPCPSNSKSYWYKAQKAARNGIKSKAESEASHMNEEWLKRWNAKNEEQLTGYEWRNNRDKLNRVTMDRWNKEI